MRKIKFRAYHKKQKKMYYNVEKTYDYGCNGDNDVLAESFAEILEDNNYDIMQYTGLKDIDGKEVYEGDIVKSYYYIDTPDGEQERYDKKVIKYDDVLCEYNINAFENIEVIGNIYDNPELLEKE